MVEVVAYKGSHLHPQWDPAGRNRVNRPLTHNEESRLQDFPEDYLWCGSKIEIARQIDNTVPVGLAQAIAAHFEAIPGLRPSTPTLRRRGSPGVNGL